MQFLNHILFSFFSFFCLSAKAKRLKNLAKLHLQLIAPVLLLKKEKVTQKKKSKILFLKPFLEMVLFF